MSSEFLTPWKVFHLLFFGLHVWTNKWKKMFTGHPVALHDLPNPQTTTWTISLRSTWDKAQPPHSCLLIRKLRLLPGRAVCWNWAPRAEASLEMGGQWAQVSLEPQLTKTVSDLPSLRVWSKQGHNGRGITLDSLKMKFIKLQIWNSQKSYLNSI